MEQTLEQKVANKIQAGIKIDFGLLFSKGWEIFKKSFWQILIGFIIIGIVSWVVSAVIGLVIPAASMDIDPSKYRPDSPEEIIEMYKDIFWMILKAQSSPLAHLSNLIVGLIVTLVSAPLTAGFYKVCRNADKGEINFGQMFSYYNNQFTGRLILMGIILTLFASVTNFLFSLIPGVGFMFNSILKLVTAILFIFSTPLIIFENASVKQALLLSIKLSMNKIFPIIGFMILCYVLGLTGFILCCIGVFLTLPYIIVGDYLVYKSAMGFDEDENPEENLEQGHWQQHPPQM